MNKRIFPAISIMLLLFISINGCCQDKSEFKLTGMRKFVYNNKDQKTEKQSYDTEGKLSTFVHYIYDANGNKIETIKYNADSLMLVRYVYFYTSDNQKAHCIKYDFAKKKEEKRVYLHNKQGQLSQTEYYNASVLTKRLVAEYSDKGDCIVKKRFNSEDKPTSESRYKYIYKNDLLLEKWRLSEANEALVKTYYEYNTDGTEKAYLRQYINGSKPDVRREFTYSSKGLCVESKVYESTK